MIHSGEHARAGTATQLTTFSHLESFVARRRDVFALLADPRKLDRVTPPWFRLTPIERDLPDLRPGATISYRFRWRGVPLTWSSLITDWLPERFFAYEQARGPFSFFRHEHHFTETPDGIEVLDVVTFRTFLGRPFDRRLVRPDLRRLFDYRARESRALLSGGSTDSPPERI